MTKEEWVKVKNELKGSFGSVILKCDGIEVKFSIEFYRELQYCIIPYIDGVWEHKWNKEDYGRRFCNVSKRSVYKRNEKDRILKNFGKRASKKYFPKLDHKIEIRYPIWKSTNSLINHLKKNNKEIELIKVGYGD